MGRESRREEERKRKREKERGGEGKRKDDRERGRKREDEVTSSPILQVTLLMSERYPLNVADKCVTQVALLTSQIDI